MKGGGRKRSFSLALSQRVRRPAVLFAVRVDVDSLPHLDLERTHQPFPTLLSRNAYKFLSRVSTEETRVRAALRSPRLTRCLFAPDRVFDLRKRFALAYSGVLLRAVCDGHFDLIHRCQPFSTRVTCSAPHSSPLARVAREAALSSTRPLHVRVDSFQRENAVRLCDAHGAVEGDRRREYVNG